MIVGPNPTPVPSGEAVYRDGRCAVCGGPSKGYVWIGATRAEYVASNPELAHEITLEPDHHNLELCSDECEWLLYPNERPGASYTVRFDRDATVRGRWKVTAEPQGMDDETSEAARTTLVRDLPSTFVPGPSNSEPDDVFDADARPDLMHVRVLRAMGRAGPPTTVHFRCRRHGGGRSRARPDNDVPRCLATRCPGLQAAARERERKFWQC